MTHHYDPFILLRIYCAQKCIISFLVYIQLSSARVRASENGAGLLTQCQHQFAVEGYAYSLAEGLRDECCIHHQIDCTFLVT